MKLALLPLDEKRRQLGGKLRRLTKSTFPFLNGHETRRFGCCNRCGACCKILYRCPFLIGTNGHYQCAIYSRRPRMCRQFPVETRDIAELDGGCTYYFFG